MGWNGFHYFQDCIGILGWDVELGHPGWIQEISSLFHMRSWKWHLASPFLGSPKICLWIKSIFNPFLPQYFSHTCGSRSHKRRQNRPGKKWETTRKRKKYKSPINDLWGKVARETGEAFLTWRKKGVSGRERGSNAKHVWEVKKENYTENRCHFGSVKRRKAWWQ